MGVTMEEQQSLLIAIDELESTLKILRYVGKVCHSIQDLSVCLLHIYPPPPPDFFVNSGNLDDYQSEQFQNSQKLFEQGISTLAEYGIDRDSITCTTHMTEGNTISDTLLKVQRMGNFSTVVVGKRGVSKAEEFLFGSVSNTLARHCNDFAVWIVG